MQQNSLAFALLLLLSAAESCHAWYPADAVQGFDQPVFLKAQVHRWQLRGIGNIMPLNGISQYLDLGNDPILHMSEHDFTVEAWVQFNALASSDPNCTAPSCGDMSLVDKMLSDSAVDFDGWRLMKTADNHLWFCLGSESDGCAGGNVTTVQSSTVVTTGPWYHVVGRKTAGALTILVNGNAEASIQLGAYTDTGRAQLLIGRNEAQGAFLNGSIDTVGLYPRALNAHQITDLFNQGAPRHHAQPPTPTNQSAAAPATAANGGIGVARDAAPSSNTASGMAAGQLRVSNSADRLASLPLDGLAVSGPLHVFLVSAAEIRQVKFWLDSPAPTRPDGLPTTIENLAPFDLMGTSPSGAALPLDPAGLSKGTHTVSAEMVAADGTRQPVITATFTIR